MNLKGVSLEIDESFCYLQHNDENFYHQKRFSFDIINYQKKKLFIIIHYLHLNN